MAMLLKLMEAHIADKVLDDLVSKLYSPLILHRNTNNYCVI